MISKVSFRNFKCLRDVQIDLERFTVFVGPNASGKSSILQAMDLLCRTFRTDQPQSLESDLQQNLRRGATDPIELACEAGGKAYRYRTQFPSAPHQPSAIAHAKWTGVGRGVAASLKASDWNHGKPVPPGSTPLPRSVLLGLEASKLVQPKPAAPDPTVMAPDGAGLHSALASIALSDPESWQLLQDRLRQIVPTVRRLRHTMRGAKNSPSLLFDMHGGDALPATQVSEGTLLVLGLLAALHASGRPSLVLLDDLDRGLHPKAQRELIALLRGVLETNSDLQIAATTHSPYLLGRMEPNEVRMTHLDENGSTVCAPLTGHPKFETWKDEMSSGEMWSLFGEKWVTEQEVST